MNVKLFSDASKTLREETVEVKDILELEKLLETTYKKPNYMAAIVEQQEVVSNTFKPGYIYFHNGNTCSWFGYKVT